MNLINGCQAGTRFRQVKLLPSLKRLPPPINSVKQQQNCFTELSYNKSAANRARPDRSPFNSLTCPEISWSLNFSTTYVNPLL